MQRWRSICISFHSNNRKYSRVRNWTLGLAGGKDQIAVIRASGSISRVRSPLSLSSSGVIGEQFIEKIRSVKGWLLLFFSFISLKFSLLSSTLFDLALGQ